MGLFDKKTSKVTQKGHPGEHLSKTKDIAHHHVGFNSPTAIAARRFQASGGDVNDVNAFSKFKQELEM